MAMTEFSASTKRKAISRELSFRRYVYPGRVLAKKMTQQQADDQIGVMEAIEVDYRRLAEAEEAASKPALLL
jgi:hypothetical protein